MEKSNSAIIRCPKCAVPLKVRSLPAKTLLVRCPACSERFYFKSEGKQTEPKSASKVLGFVVIISLFVIDVAIAAYAFPTWINYANRTHQQHIAGLDDRYKGTLAQIKADYEEKLQSIDGDSLRQLASENYQKIWAERSNYDSRYAISDREKAQLQMLALSQDKTKPVQETIQALAALSAPNNSQIVVTPTGEGFILDIDFDMSELSPREKGARTGHSSIASLKEEVKRLTYQVTNDVYQFSRDLDLFSIQIGCRHVVKMEGPYNLSPSTEQTMVIYKVKLDRQNIRELKHNPFLDIYSTERYISVLLDDFHNLRLVNA
jgi:DNA-directed RNA polymerase subunit RPC12/RpoP